jgi:tRNA (cmo5U34)-methyltransferase
MTVDAVTYFEERAHEYDASRTVRFGKYAEALEIIALMLPFDRDEAITVLDLGCGTGELSRTIGERFRRAHLLCLDAAPTMLRIAEQKLRAGGLRVTPVQRDFSQPGWAEGLPPCHAVVASYALNHVPVTSQRSALAECLSLLRPGGIFLSLDGFTPVDPLVAEVYGRLRASESSDEGTAETETPANDVEVAHFFTTMAERISLMEEVGYSPVDCVWKYFKLGVLVGHVQATRCGHVPL